MPNQTQATKKRQVTLRIEEEQYQKIRIQAFFGQKSINSTIEKLLNIQLEGK